MDTNNPTVLFVNHKPQKCGVYEFGKAIGDVLINSKKFNFIYTEIDNWKEFNRIFHQFKPAIVIYNYHPLRWDGSAKGKA